MKKNLLLSFLSLPLFFAQAQEIQTISFEASENYILGPLNGQNGWETYGTIEDQINVVNTLFSEGAQATHLISNSDFEFKGFSKSTTIDKTIVEVSLDVYIDQAEGSETMFDIVDENTDVNYSLNFGMDGTIWVGIGGYLLQLDGLTYDAEKWYNVKFIVDNNANKLSLYLDNELIDESTSEEFNVTKLDFYVFDLGSGFVVDNINIVQKNDMSNEDISRNKINIYPNPVSNVLNIDLHEKVLEATIYDVNGRILLKSSGNKIDVQRLQKGNYIIQIKTSTNTFTKKFIKK